jgi:diguanylate cyclase (GGDEF)-like protein
VDLLARYGGEEFVALLPNTGGEDGARAAERIRRAIESRVVPFEGPEGRQDAHCTVSIGLATHPAQDVPTAEELVRKADDRLYAAKAAGRNRVVAPPR